MTPADKTALVERVRARTNIAYENASVEIMTGREHADLLALCDLAESPDCWLPIETAPRDGTCILLAQPNETAFEGYFMGNPKHNHWGETGWFDTGADVLTQRPLEGLTSWQPLPTGPKN